MCKGNGMTVGDIVRPRDKTSVPVRFRVVSVADSGGEPCMVISAIRPYKDKYEELVAYLETHLVPQSAFMKIGRLAA